MYRHFVETALGQTDFTDFIGVNCFFPLSLAWSIIPPKLKESVMKVMQLISY